MTKFTSRTVCMAVLLAGSSFGTAAFAQGQAPASADSAASDQGEGATIIVEARRRGERAIDVPLTVTGLSSEDLTKQNILSFKDVNEVVPGLNLVSGNNGLDANATIRGISYNISSQVNPPYATYVNEVAAGLNDLFNEVYDVGRIEIQRGPQGTLRGVPASSGLFGIYTKRPDLNEAGGYVSTTLTDPRGINLQGAVGVPLVKDILAIRVAGVFDRTANGDIRSANNSKKPFTESKGGRATLLFQPTPDFTATLIYRHNEFNSAAYQGAVFGTGAPAFSFPPSDSFAGVNIPANFNGPAIGRRDDLAVGAFPTEVYGNSDNITLMTDLSFSGQKLSYIGSRNWYDTRTETPSDVFNIMPGRAPNLLDQHLRAWSHEIRLSSEERIGGFLDYTIGYLNQKTNAKGVVAVGDVALLPGAFGSTNGNFVDNIFGTPLGFAFPVTPGVLNPLNLNRAFAINFVSAQDTTPKTEGLFGNLTAHIGEKTEISAGVRQVWQSTTTASVGGTTPALLAFGYPSEFGPCALGGLGDSPYEDTCTITIPATPIATAGKASENPVLWIASASHKFTPDLMAYVTAGTSFRAAPVGALGVPQCGDCNQYGLGLKSERSTSYEVGLKGSIFDRKLTFSVAYFYQTFKNFISRNEQAIPFLQTLPDGTQSIRSDFFIFNAPVKTQGIDLDVDYRASDDLQLGAAFSYAKSRFRNALIPCADSNFDGTPDSNQGPVNVTDWNAAGGPDGPALCRTNGPLASTPPWNLILRGEYSHDAFTDTRAFLRTVMNITPKNTNNKIVNPAFVPEGYALVDLFVGLRDTDGAWELSLAAKNLFNNRTVLGQGQQTGLITQGEFAFFPQSTGYRTISRVPGRQFQVSFRYAFGGR